MTLLPARRFAVALLALVLGGLLVAATSWAVGGGPRAEDGERLRPGPVLLVGVAGLSWDDVTPETTPTLARWQAEGASGALVVRGSLLVTCPADGWLTLSAGQRAAALGPGAERTGCPAPSGPQDGDAEPLAGWSAWQEAAAAQGLGTRLGTLASALAADGACVAAYGPLAALGAADQAGRVSPVSVDAGPPDLGQRPCDVLLVDGGTASGPEGAAALDEELTALEDAGLPEDLTVVVAGLADPTARPGLRVVVVHGQGAGILTSPGTRQPGLLQTADLTATLLSMAGVEPPEAVAGQPVRLVPAATPVDAQQVRDTATGATLAQALAGPVLTATVLLLLLGLVAAHLLAGRAVPVVATLAQAVPAAAFLAGLLPWWRVARADADEGELWTAGFALGAAIALPAAVLCALAWAGPWRRAATGPPAVVAALTVLVIGADVILGGPLGLVSVLGVQPATGGRFYGMGNVALGAVAASVVLLAGVVAASLRDRRLLAAGAVLALGGAAALVDGLPQWGADFGGVPALLVATGLLALAAGGVRLTPTRVALVGLGAVAAAAVLMVVDWLRPAGSRTHLGDFVQSVLDGQAWGIVGRKLEQSLDILVRFPASWLAVALLGLVVWAVAAPASRPGRVIAPLWRVPLLRAACGSLLAGLAVGWLLNDSGVAILGMGLAVAVPALLAVLARIGQAPGPAPAEPADEPRPHPAV